MKTSEIIAYYGNQTKAAQAIGIYQGSLSHWGEYPPPLRQHQYEKLTEGKLKAEPIVIKAKQEA